MSESRRSSSHPRRFRQRLRRAADLLLPGDRLSDFAAWAVLIMLAALLLLFVVREICDSVLTGCPGYDGVTHKREEEALCAEPYRGREVPSGGLNRERGARMDRITGRST
jgi:hypothetical protein